MNFEVQQPHSDIEAKTERAPAPRYEEGDDEAPSSLRGKALQEFAAKLKTDDEDMIAKLHQGLNEDNYALVEPETIQSVKLGDLPPAMPAQRYFDAEAPTAKPEELAKLTKTSNAETLRSPGATPVEKRVIFGQNQPDMDLEAPTMPPAALEQQKTTSPDKITDQPDRDAEIGESPYQTSSIVDKNGETYLLKNLPSDLIDQLDTTHYDQYAKIMSEVLDARKNAISDVQVNKWQKQIYDLFDKFFYAKNQDVKATITGQGKQRTTTENRPSAA